MLTAPDVPPGPATVRTNTLLRALNQVNTGADVIINRPAEPPDSRQKATQLSARIRAIVNPQP